MTALILLVLSTFHFPDVAAGFPLPGNGYVVQRSRTGADGLFHRVEAVKNIHLDSLLGGLS